MNQFRDYSELSFRETESMKYAKAESYLNKPQSTCTEKKNGFELCKEDSLDIFSALKVFATGLGFIFLYFFLKEIFEIKKNILFKVLVLVLVLVMLYLEKKQMIAILILKKKTYLTTNCMIIYLFNTNQSQLF